MKTNLRSIIFILSVVLLSQAPAQSVFINELHYDNESTDVNEGVEIAGPAGTDLSGWTVEFYNGSNGTVYATLNLSGTIDDEGSGFGSVWFAQSGIQNGAPDGLALVDASSSVVQFLSYEGSFTATDGTANGMTSTDIGVSETSSTTSEESLQLTGSGNVYTDFSWAGPAARSNGDINSGQTFVANAETRVFFASSSASVAEDAGTYDLVVSISNPDAGTATSADVVLISGDAADINNYTTQTVTFPAGSSDNQTVTITITDDSDIEGDEDLVFELQNVTGGNNAAASNPSQFTLTIEDNDFASVPNIVINEIMQNPAAVDDDKGEWFELFNPGDSDVDINGWVIKDDGTDYHTIDNGGPLVISAGGYLVLGINDTLAVNGGVSVDYVYSSFVLGNSSDEVVLVYSDGVSEVDRVNYDNGATFPDPTGKSMELNNPANDNNDGSNWDEAIVSFGDGDMGTPGSQNSNFVNAISGTGALQPNRYKLYPNFPNPFNPCTTISYHVPKAAKVKLSIYNMQGQKVATLINGTQSAGTHHVVWNAAGFASGMYLYKLTTNHGFSQTRKMIVLK